MQQLMLIEPGRLAWEDVPEPRIQGPAEAIVRPIAASNCDLDRAVVAGRAPIPGPFAIGHEFVAEVLEVGDGVHRTLPGQRVVVPWKISCGTCERCGRGLTSSCSAVPELAMYGLPLGGSWGSALSELVRVPFADHMLVSVPSDIRAEAIASAGDNLPDAWRTVAPYLHENPGTAVLVVGGGSIGLYAVGIAVALGASQVDYLDSNPDRLRIAEALGARPIEGSPPDRLGPYPITVDAGARPAGLECALRSTEPGGICTSVGIYFSNTSLPLLDMYRAGMTFKTGICHARPVIPEVLELVRSGRLRPELVTTVVVPWDDAPNVYRHLPIKAVFVREPALRRSQR